MNLEEWLRSQIEVLKDDPEAIENQKELDENWVKKGSGGFLTDLVVKKCGDDCWELVKELRYQPRQGRLIIVPTGFQTDFASVPRLPFAFLLAGATAEKSAVIHDYLYHVHGMSRKRADNLFLQAMKDERIAWWRRYVMWGAVRLFGIMAYKRKSAFGLKLPFHEF